MLNFGKNYKELNEIVFVVEKGLEMAQKLSSILYENNFEAFKSLDIDQFEKLCDKDMLSKLHLKPGITVVEAAVKAGVFPTESMQKILNFCNFYYESQIKLFFCFCF